MQLLGQLTNVSPRVERVLAAFPGGAPKAQPRTAAGAKVVVRFGNGVIRRAVVRVLADGQARGRGDIWKAVEDLLGEPVSVESVCCSLRKGCKEDPQVFERVDYGVYRLARR